MAPPPQSWSSATDGEPLTAADQATVGQLAQTSAGASIPKVSGAFTGPHAVSPDKLVQLINVGLEAQPARPGADRRRPDIRAASDPVLDGTGLTAGDR